MINGNNELVSRDFIANKDGHMFIKPGFDADYYTRAKKDKPRKNKNYQKHLKLDVDSKLHFSVTVPVKMNMGGAPMAVIELHGEVARAFINASIDDRKQIVKEYFSSHNWRDMVDGVLMTADAVDIEKFIKKVIRFAELLGKTPPNTWIQDNKWIVAWTPVTHLTIDGDGNAVLRRNLGKVTEEFNVLFDDQEDIILGKLMELVADHD